MSGLGLVTVAIGVLVIATRGPFVFAPEATMRVFRRMIDSDMAVRGVGLFALALGAAVITLPAGVPGPAAQLLRVLGWFWLVAGGVFAVFPVVYQGMAEAVFGMMQGNERVLGVVGVVFGAGFIALGFAIG